jgi:hypothetical protein
VLGRLRELHQHASVPLAARIRRRLARSRRVDQARTRNTNALQREHRVPHDPRERSPARCLTP